MDVGPVIALGVMVLLTVAGHLLLPSREKRIRGELEAYPEALIRDGNGALRVSGRVRRAGEPLEAPLSGRPCVAYSLVADAPVRLGGGPNSGGRRRFVDLRQACPFLVEDESGTARIDTSGPFRLALGPVHTGTTRGPYPGNHRALALLLESRGVVATNWRDRWRPIDYAEGVLEQDQLVSVGGPSNREPDQAGERRGPRSPPLRLVLRGTEAKPLLIGTVAPKG